MVLVARGGVAVRTSQQDVPPSPVIYTWRAAGAGYNKGYTGRQRGGLFIWQSDVLLVSGGSGEIGDVSGVSV